MVKILVLVATAIIAVRVVLAELAGAALIVIAVGMLAGTPGALIATGLCVLAKSFEWDLTDKDPPA